MKAITARLIRLETATVRTRRRMVIILAGDNLDADRQLEALRLIGNYSNGDGLICVTGPLNWRLHDHRIPGATLRQMEAKSHGDSPPFLVIWAQPRTDLKVP